MVSNWARTQNLGITKPDTYPLRYERLLSCVCYAVTYTELMTAAHHPERVKVIATAKNEFQPSSVIFHTG